MSRASRHTSQVWPSIYSFSGLGEASASVAELREALFTNHLVVIKGLGGISVPEFAIFAAYFGTPEEPLAGSSIHPLDERVETLLRTRQDKHYTHSLSDANKSGLRKPSSFYWHADRSFLPSPSFLTATRVVAKPSEGGATNFINTEMAYAALDETGRSQLDGLVGVHSYAHYHKSLAGENIYDPEEVRRKQKLYHPVAHEVVQRHPITGRTVAYISPLTLEGFTDPSRDAATTLSTIVDEGQPAHYSHQWENGDIVIWDNFGVLHRGTPSNGERELQRVTLALSG